MSDTPFNPLDIGNLASSIVTHMIETGPTPLGNIKRFTGIGLYAIYYTGDFPPYDLLAQRNRDGAFTEPIYVGKGVPKGGRRGGVGGGKSPQPDVTTARSQNSHLYTRLSKHANSVRVAENLNIDDFWARWLVVEQIWIPLGESALIRRHRPVWNTVIDGFGNNDPGAGRHDGIISRWDTLHPGRSWVTKLRPRAESADDVGQEAEEYLRSRFA